MIDKPAMVVENEFKTLVIADLHLGIEAELREKGINIGSQTEKLLERVITCVKAAEPDVILLLGDVKHAVPRISWMDRKEVPFFLAGLAEYAPVYVVKGNHDGHLNRLLPKTTEPERKPEHEVCIKSTKGFLFDGVGYTHGHSWPLQDLFSAKYVLIGHNHPRIKLASSQLRYGSTRSVWIRAKCDYDAVKEHYTELRKSGWNDPWVIIMPAFNEICGGITFNAPTKRLLGPIASKLLRLEDMEVYLLDWTYIVQEG